MTPLTEFWLETNPCWGWVSNAEEWREKICLWTGDSAVKEPKLILTARATLATDEGSTDCPCFGFYSEHRGQTLQEWIDAGMLPSWVLDVVTELQNNLDDASTVESEEG